ncbi:FKBP-type peptidyl-prolyl cis-trans isomerase [Gordonia sp. (in: high G+C Gram-positive bacteria)]|uniref:FKBP-type peptidyl-prolyl cis-trans isomerase n=1 Tax=Gordonia sp. (in: high G+C Gram-positive bacteria) TaxID=84139 RepID=UPI003C7286DF
MKVKCAILIPVAASALLVAGCSSGSSDSVPTSLTITQATPAMEGGVCPEADPAVTTGPQWTISGATGKLAVAAATDTAGPLIKVTAPFSVDETQVKTLEAGTGKEITDEMAVNVCYEGVDGRDGQVFDSSFQRGTPLRLRTDGVVPGFRRALVGQRVGASVAVAMTPDDGYPDGSPDGTIKPGDTIIFVLKIMAAEKV